MRPLDSPQRVAYASPMQGPRRSDSGGAGEAAAPRPVLPILLAISFSHLLNDTLQSLIPAIYPLVKESFHLSYSQVGLITFTFQLTASLLQPLVGFYTDHRPQPYSLAAGMGCTLLGLVALSQVTTYPLILLSVAVVGLGSAIFHPEASRMAHAASGGRLGFAQSFFQVGGQAGSALGPLLAALVIGTEDKSRVLWFSSAALLAMVVLGRVGHWYQHHHIGRAPKRAATPPKNRVVLSSRKVGLSITILIALIFSKYFYMVSLTSYYTFYLISRFQLSIPRAQFYLFAFLFAVAAGTFMGGPLGDRFGRKYVIWISILGAAPFTLLLPYATLFWTGVLSVIIGAILASAFSAILVYAQELVPGRVGLMAGLFFGLAFGMAGIGSAVLGHLADHTSIHFMFQVCSFLPLIGLLTGLLPDLERSRAPARPA